ncbi:MAG: PQQ-dependent sugar dehydrogenase, partial [Nitrospirae bacterium]|nr:PQQ-dependent sugar dehydrogenase [Nitrospirota bacterium]
MKTARGKGQGARGRGVRNGLSCSVLALACLGLASLGFTVAECSGSPAEKTPSSIALEPIVSEGLYGPVYVTHAGDASGRLFVVEQPGRIRVIQNGRLLPAPFLDMRTQVSYGGERGLLGLAFHPAYKQNGRYFVNYT